MCEKWELVGVYLDGSQLPFPLFFFPSKRGSYFYGLVCDENHNSELSFILRFYKKVFESGCFPMEEEKVHWIDSFLDLHKCDFIIFLHSHFNFMFVYVIDKVIVE